MAFIFECHEWAGLFLDNPREYRIRTEGVAARVASLTSLDVERQLLQWSFSGISMEEGEEEAAVYRPGDLSAAGDLPEICNETELGLSMMMVAIIC